MSDPIQFGMIEGIPIVDGHEKRPNKTSLGYAWVTIEDGETHASCGHCIPQKVFSKIDDADDELDLYYDSEDEAIRALMDAIGRYCETRTPVEQKKNIEPEIPIPSVWAAKTFPSARIRVTGADRTQRHYTVAFYAIENAFDGQPLGLISHEGLIKEFDLKAEGEWDGDQFESTRVNGISNVSKWKTVEAVIGLSAISIVLWEMGKSIFRAISH